MGRVTAAFRVFFKTLFDGSTAERVEALLRGGVLPGPMASGGVPGTETSASGPTRASTTPVSVSDSPGVKLPVTPPAATASDAVLLLATLQREARLVDFLKEDLSAYSDDQIGAAVREVHRDAGKVLERLFGLRPVVTEEDGAAVDVPVGFDAGRFRLTGKVAGAAPFRGTLRHHGWEATHVQLPTFTGSAAAAKTIAPAEVEIG